MTQEESFTAPSGWALHYFPETSSTNDLAGRSAEEGAPEKSVFVTDHQTRGRGRMDRSWLEETGSSLLFSVVFRRHYSEPFLLTMMSSVAAAEAIERVAGTLTEIKWPNDLMVNGKKVAGVLTEVNWGKNNPFAVVGMGINVNFDPRSVSDIPETATSLLREGGSKVSRPELLYQILSGLEVLMSMGEGEMEKRVRALWASRLWRRQQRVVIAEDGRELVGVFEDVAEDGALLLRLLDGTLQTVRVGDLLI